MNKSLLAAALALAAASTQALAFSYDNLEGGYGEIDDADSLFLKGSKSLDKNLFVLGGAYLVDENNFDGFYLEGGLGYHLPLSKQADLVMSAQLLYGDFDYEVRTPFGTAKGNEDDLGAILRAGVRFTPVDKVELEGNLAVSSNDTLIDDGIGLDAYARYAFTNEFSGALGLHSDTELDGISLSVRYNFR